MNKEAESAWRQDHGDPGHHKDISLRIADRVLAPALPVKRHRDLLRLLRSRGQLTVRDVASRFEVSVDTARRDLDLLAQQGLLSRTYGGAVAVEKPGLPGRDRNSRLTCDLLKERVLARSFDQLIKDGETLLLNGGFAARSCVEALGCRSVKVVTNSLDLPLEIVTNAEVYVLGGKCRPDAGVTVGPILISGINITVDSAIIGVDGIAAIEGLTASLPEEALMASEMIAAAKRTIVVADSSRFGQRSFARIGPLERMQVLVTDKEPPGDLARALHEAQVEVIITAAMQAADGQGRMACPERQTSFHQS